ncbi:MAG: acetyl-CoA carboxylase biotin carboxyl carrier protein subunit [Bacteroidota bacterium]|nr:acetyl-CoA carboxylase biotin carboxyl carrier protein subunit [Bacteroidota bacterium]
MSKDKPTTLTIDDTQYETNFSVNYLRRTGFKRKDNKKLLAFIPGAIKSISIKKGDKITAGQSLLILEAMKMQNIVTSTIDGTIKSVNVKQGQTVTKNEVLIELV